MLNGKIHLLYTSIVLGLVFSNCWTYSNQETIIIREATSRAPASLSSKILGNTERVRIGDTNNLSLIAKVDTGAEASSLHAEDLKTFYKNDQQYITFTTTSDSGEKVMLTYPVTKIDIVKSALGENTRYFIEETVWIGPEAHIALISLADRGHLSKKFLIGKDLLNKGFLVDTNQEMLADNH